MLTFFRLEIYYCVLKFLLKTKKMCICSQVVSAKFQNYVEIASNELGEAEAFDEFQNNDNIDMGNYDCHEYKSKIWDAAFQNEAPMLFFSQTMDSIVDMATDETCSDTIQSLIQFIETLSTDPNTQYTIRMFAKMFKTILKKSNDDPDNFKETKKVVSRLLFSPNVQNLALNSLMRTFMLLKNPDYRRRLLNVAKTVYELKFPNKTNAVKPLTRNGSRASFRKT